MELEGSSLNTILALKAKKAADEANERIDNLPKGVNYKGSVNYFNDLPTDAENGDMYTVKYKGTTGTTPDEREFVWGEYEGTLQWNELGAQGDTLNVEDNVLIASAGTMENIEMNPTLSGTEQALTGIKVGDGPAYKVDSGKLVEVTYGVTTYDEVTTLVNQGKVPYVTSSGVKLYYNSTVSNEHRFGNNYGTALYGVRLSETNVWIFSVGYAESTSNKENAVTPTSTTKYPSSKAVADYVAQQIGNAIGGNY